MTDIGQGQWDLDTGAMVACGDGPSSFFFLTSQGKRVIHADQNEAGNGRLGQSRVVVRLLLILDGRLFATRFSREPGQPSARGKGLRRRD